MKVKIKNEEFEVIYEQVECPDLDQRIFNALSMLISLDDLYEKQD